MPDTIPFMRAIARDPDCIFVCWEIAPDSLEEITQKVGLQTLEKSSWIIRILDVTDILLSETSAWQTLDVKIDLSEQKKYIQVPEPGRTYLLKCGVITPDARFNEVACSNVCAVPRKGMSQRTDEAWAMVNSAELLRLSTDALKNGGVSREQLNGVGLNLGDGSGSGSIF